MKKQISYRIASIFIQELEVNIPKSKDGKTAAFNYQINIERKINSDDNIIRVICTVKLLTDDDNNLLGKITVAHDYKVDNLNELLVPEKKEIKIPNIFFESLHSISLSTTRGVMFSAFKGTYLENVVLPLIDISKIEEVNK